MAIWPGVGRADGRVGAERRLDRLFEIDRELELAELTRAVLLQRRERRQHLGGRAAARAHDLPAQIEEAGADGAEARGEHGAAILAPTLGELERADA